MSWFICLIWYVRYYYVCIYLLSVLMYLPYKHGVWYFTVKLFVKSTLLMTHFALIKRIIKSTPGILAGNHNFFINVHDDSSKTKVRKINDHSLVIIKSKKDCSFQEIHPYKRFGGKRFPCKYCTIHGVRAPISGRILRSYHGCETCGVALCRNADRNCFFNYHKELLQNSEENDRYISEYKLYPK